MVHSSSLQQILEDFVQHMGDVQAVALLQRSGRFVAWIPSAPFPYESQLGVQLLDFFATTDDLLHLARKEPYEHAVMMTAAGMVWILPITSTTLGIVLTTPTTKYGLMRYDLLYLVTQLTRCINDTTHTAPHTDPSGTI